MLVWRHGVAGAAMRVSVISWATTEADVDRSVDAILGMRSEFHEWLAPAAVRRGGSLNTDDTDLRKRRNQILVHCTPHAQPKRNCPCVPLEELSAH